MRRVAGSLLLVVVGAASGCAPVDISGNYTVSLTNGDNGCDFDNWMVGDTTSGVPMAVTQTEDQLQLNVGGVGGAYLDIALGSSTFNGQIQGTGVTAALVGSRGNSLGMCTFTVTVDLDASVSGDFMEGTLTYRPVTNMHADCAPIEGCQSVQSFNGTRPPPP